jgi:hypothetical protein
VALKGFRLAAEFKNNNYLKQLTASISIGEIKATFKSSNINKSNFAKMKNNDLIQLVFTEEQITENNTHLEALLAMANANAPGLTPEQRSAYGSINETNKLLVNKARVLMKENPKYIPAFVNIKEFEQDFAARENIETMIRKLDQIRLKLNDTKILLDNDNYLDAMAYYRAVRYFAGEHDQEAMPLYDELKQFFPNNSSQKEKKEK